MSPLLAFLAFGPVCFAAGVIARPYLERIVVESRNHMPSIERKPKHERSRHPRTILLMLAFTTVVACAALIYTAQSKDASERANAETQQCISEQFAELSESLNARADLAQRESNAVADVLVTAASASSSREVERALRRYDVERRAIARERRDNPLPKFPTGRCDEPGNHEPSAEFSGGVPDLGEPADRLDGIDTAALAGAATAIHQATRDEPLTADRRPARPASPPPNRPRPAAPPAPGTPEPVTEVVDTVTETVDEAVEMGEDVTESGPCVGCIVHDALETLEED